MTELNLRFPDKDHVIVRLGADDDGSGELAFTNPLTDHDARAIHWYIETYAAHSLGDPDDSEAHRIQKQLPVWGKALFDAVFTEREAQRRFTAFQDADGDARLITISAEHPGILALPWELLHESSTPDGTFLFHEQPSISIRRRVAGAIKGRRPFKPARKDSLRILFVVSRPEDVGFIDPRADSEPVLDAIDQHAPGRVTCEFLRPPTLDALNDRLADSNKPPLDIIHFDGHGVFDRDGNLPNRAAAAQAARIIRLEELLKSKQVDVPVDPDCPPNMGYLLFERADGRADFVSADKLGANLHRHKVALVILSACQSGTVGRQEAEQDDQAVRPMGSVAARLTATGIPSVLAMTHSVLVHTTRMLFGEFYKQLARHKGIGEALDHARRYLFNHPEKYEVQRGLDRVPLKLYDWFLPALYQQGADTALLKKSQGSKGVSAVRPRTNLPKAPEGGFFGRRRWLWEIERWFAGETRRITLTGFGGQGKTALALEAGRWLTRTGSFQAAVFVDYSRVQADAVVVAKNEIGKVLNQTFIDADAATAALKETPTLVILDNLEALEPDSLRALLDVAVQWSQAGGSRVLCTTRRPDFGHADYKTASTLVHRRITLDGLGDWQAPDDALEWTAALLKLPPAPSVPAPTREALIELFDRVKFHPLSIRVLAQQLKTRRIEDVGMRLAELIGTAARAERQTSGSKLDEDTPAGLLASLELSLDTLDDAARQVLPRLGVFQGGAFEDDLIAITGMDGGGRRKELEGLLADIEAGRVQKAFDAMKRPVPDDAGLAKAVSSLRASLAALPPRGAENLWAGLRRQLESAALIEAESIAGVGVPYLRFHPTLAPMLFARLDATVRESLLTAYRRRYYSLSAYLYDKDSQEPHATRAIAWQDLPNLLHAAHAALDVGEPDAVDFADNVSRFAGAIFGLKQESERLWAKARATTHETGSRSWYLQQSSRGEQLLYEGQAAAGAKVFQEILQELRDTPTFERATTLVRLGRCFARGGRPDLAAQKFSEAMSVCEELKPTASVKTLQLTLMEDKAGVLAGQGKYAEARQSYLEALKMSREIGAERADEGVLHDHLGSLALQEGDLPQALERYQNALAVFQQLRDPAREAIAWHQLGLSNQLAERWDEAERHYRESARIKEQLQDLAGAARTWNQLGLVCKATGKVDAAERWFSRAVEGGRQTGDLLPASNALANLANLLQLQPGRLTDARRFAEEALAIKRALDPGAAEIWKLYDLLAVIADREALAETDDQRKTELQEQARVHRRLARDARRNFSGTRHHLRKFADLILGTVAATQDPELRKSLEDYVLKLEQRGWANLVAAIHRILSGERDTNALCEQLDLEDAMIVEAIMAGLADPSTLSDLVPAASPPPE